MVGDSALDEEAPATAGESENVATKSKSRGAAKMRAAAVWSGVCLGGCLGMGVTFQGGGGCYILLARASGGQLSMSSSPLGFRKKLGHNGVA
jgi:hypothetical protein